MIAQRRPLHSLSDRRNLSSLRVLFRQAPLGRRRLLNNHAARLCHFLAHLHSAPPDPFRTTTAYSETRRWRCVGELEKRDKIMVLPLTGLVTKGCAITTRVDSVKIPSEDVFSSSEIRLFARLMRPAKMGRPPFLFGCLFMADIMEHHCTRPMQRTSEKTLNGLRPDS